MPAATRPCKPPRLGVEVLRRARINLYFIWVGTLIVVGSIALGVGLWPLMTG